MVRSSIEALSRGGESAPLLGEIDLSPPEGMDPLTT